MSKVAVLNEEWEVEKIAYTRHGELVAKRKNFIVGQPFPALAVKACELKPHGLHLYQKPIEVQLLGHWENDFLKGLCYSVSFDAVFYSPLLEVKLVMRFKGEAPTLELLVDAVGADKGIELCSIEPPVPGGPGQFKRCREEAEYIYRNYGHLIPTEGFSVIQVPYIARGGKRGTMQKPAVRCYYRDDFAETMEAPNA